jgi:hypothetical protein
LVLSVAGCWLLIACSLPCFVQVLLRCVVSGQTNLLGLTPRIQRLSDELYLLDTVAPIAVPHVGTAAVYPKDALWMPSHGTRRKQSPQVEVCFWNLESVTLSLEPRITMEYSLKPVYNVPGLGYWVIGFSISVCFTPSP